MLENNFIENLVNDTPDEDYIKSKRRLIIGERFGYFLILGFLLLIYIVSVIYGPWEFYTVITIPIIIIVRWFILRIIRVSKMTLKQLRDYNPDDEF